MATHDKSKDESKANADVQSAGIPKVEPKPEVLTPAETGVPDDSQYKGSYIREADGEPYGLAVIPGGGEYGRTHFAKNSLHFWSGSADSFKLQFSKK